MLLLAALLAPLGLPGAAAPPVRTPPNVLVVVADDLGVDQLAAYGEGSDLPSTPHVDALAAAGVLFRNAWSNPLCSPTRAAIQTGRYGFRTGIGTLAEGSAQPLALAETTLPEMLRAQAPVSYASGAFGKWHLGDVGVGGPLAPNAAGYDHYAGSLGNLFPPHELDPPPYDYFFWPRVVDGATSEKTGYITSVTVDDASAWIATAPEPWLAYVAFHTPHAPFHAPPDALHGVDLSGAGPPESDPRPYYKAMVESLDTELGRLLRSIEPLLARTTIVFVGDNGSPPLATVAPFDPSHAKPTLYEGGINVPLIVAGAGVSAPGSECAALVGATDLFATLAELAGALLPLTSPGTEPLDSVSLVPYLRDPAQPSLRQHVFAELFKPNGPGPYGLSRRAIRNERYKLLRYSEKPDELYDLWADPFEQADLLLGPLRPEEELALRELRVALTALLAGS